MNPRLHALLGFQHGVVSAAEALAVGTDHLALRRAVARRELVRVRRGAYVDGASWSAADVDERYRLAVLAVARTRPGDAVSHHAALALRRLPLWGHDRRRFDLVSDVRQITARSGLHLHPGAGVETSQVDGVATVSVARSVVRTALTMGRECAVVAGDAALRAGLVTPEALMAEAALVSPHQGRGRALDAVLAMDGRSESVGESRTRLILDDLGLAHDSQVVIEDARGEFLARVDFLVEGVVLEFDGRVKYGRSRDDVDAGAADPGEVVWLEKRREDRVRRLGYPFERVVWDELARPGILGARLRAARPSPRTGRREPHDPRRRLAPGRHHHPATHPEAVRPGGLQPVCDD